MTELRRFDVGRSNCSWKRTVGKIKIVLDATIVKLEDGRWEARFAEEVFRHKNRKRVISGLKDEIARCSEHWYYHECDV